MTKPVKLYVSTECGSCEDVKAAVKDENYEVLGVSADLELIDIDTVANDFIFGNFPGLPGALYGERVCKLFINEETQKLTVDCSKD